MWQKAICVGLGLGVEKLGDSQRSGGYFLGSYGNVLHHNCDDVYTSYKYDKNSQTLYLIWVYFIATNCPLIKLIKT